MDNEEVPKKKKEALPEDVDKMEKALQQLRKAITGDLEDLDQEELVKVIQQNRAFVLEYALSAYLDNPKNAHLLEGVTQILAQVEKTVRDDRKERMKKKDSETNQLGFAQLMDALNTISTGGIKLPVFDFKDFILDPSKPIVQSPNADPINDDELTQGNFIVDIDGNKVP